MNHFKAVREKMTERGLDAVIINSEANRFYTCAFPTMAPEDAIVIVAKEKSYVITDSRYIEAAEAQVKDAEVCLRDDRNTYNSWIKRILEENAVKKLGFEEEELTVSGFENYKKEFPVEFLPCSELFGQLRQSKDDEEIACMIKAQRIAEDAFEELTHWLREGQSEKQIAAYLQYLMLSRGAERVSFEPIAASGPNSSMPHAVPTDRTIRAGDFLTLDFGAVYGNYCSDMTRTLAIGYATDEMKKVYETVLAAQAAGIAAAHAGVIGRDVHNAAAKVIADAGYGGYFGHGFGHSVGLQIHEDPNFNTRNDRPVPDRAVISAEPGIYLPGNFGVRIEDVIILREGGCEDITLSPKELTVIPV